MTAGMSLGGGKRENFFFRLLEHFPKEDRWFLTSLKQVKDRIQWIPNPMFSSKTKFLIIASIIVNSTISSTASAHNLVVTSVHGF